MLPFSSLCTHFSNGSCAHALLQPDILPTAYVRSFVEQDCSYSSSATCCVQKIRHVKLAVLPDELTYVPI